MKIENKILLSNTLSLVLIAVIGLFAIRETNLVLTKLHFVEIADDLNASFLEMRLSEKNYFLYKEAVDLRDILDKLDSTYGTIMSERESIELAVGRDTIDELVMRLSEYRNVVDKVLKSQGDISGAQELVREKGKALRTFSDDITRAERDNVNRLVYNAAKLMLFGTMAVIVISFVILRVISRKVSRSLRTVETLAETISQGDFHLKGLDAPSNDEVGSVIRAINQMSERLAEREDELVQAKKLSSLGILTAGVAHELTNPLNNISMTAQTYQELYAKLSEAQRISFMATIESETDRIRDIVRNLLDFAKPKELALQPIDINEVIRHTLPLVRNMLEISNLDLDLDLRPGLPRVVIDEGQIRQVLVNLITNAAQASSPRMSISISSRRAAAGGVEASVSDTGKGIPQEQVPHLFDPFFTTKGEGGTGLGLSISYGIIKKHGGEIRVSSTVGKGSTFTVVLPSTPAVK